MKLHVSEDNTAERGDTLAKQASKLTGVIVFPWIPSMKAWVLLKFSSRIKSTALDPNLVAYMTS